MMKALEPLVLGQWMTIINNTYVENLSWTLELWLDWGNFYATEQLL